MKWCHMKNDFNIANTEEILRTHKARAVFLKTFSALMGVEIKTAVEIGVFEGENAKSLRSLFPDMHLYLVDPWNLTDDYLKDGGPISQQQAVMDAAFFQVLHDFFEDTKTQILRLSSFEASQRIEGPLDLVFIDGDHSYEGVKQDISLWLPKVRSGGIISGHDYDYPELPGVRKAVDEVLGEDVFTGPDFTWIKIVE